MAKDYIILKKQAILLRKLGKSYGEIKQEIPVSKSTLSFWLKGIPLTNEQRHRLYTKNVRALNLGPQSQRERRLREVAKITEEAEREAHAFKTKESYKLFGAALYWAEGSKANGFSIANSDPYLIIFIVRWLNVVFGITAERLTITLNIYPQQNEAHLKEFWSELTGVPLENFRKTFIKPPNKAYKKNNLYYGTCKLRVAKGTDLRYRVFGWIKEMLSDARPKVEFTQREWRSLQEVVRPANM